MTDDHLWEKYRQEHGEEAYKALRMETFAAIRKRKANDEYREQHGISYEAWVAAGFPWYVN